MPFKKILCVLAHGKADAAALDTAFATARTLGAHVVVLNVRADARDSIPMLGEGVSAALVEEIMANAERENAARAAAAHRLFEERRQAAGVTLADTAGPVPGTVTASWVDNPGRAEQMVVQAARLSDLAIFPNPLDGADTDAALVLETALLASGRPILVAPATPPASIGSQVAIAWNGSEQATRAVAAAMDMLARASSVHILTAATSRTDVERGTELQEYLAWHGITATVREVAPGSESVGAALLNAAAGLGADLMVMGGYGSSRLRELIMGGVTRHVLGHASVPVLMAH